MGTQRKKSAPPGVGGLLAGMGVFVIVGFPMVFFIWQFINEILSGRFIPLDAALAAVFLILFIGFLRVLAKRVRRWDADLMM